MADFSEQDRQYFHEDVGFSSHNEKKSSSTTLSIAKVFGYMGIGLLITAIVAFGLGALIYYNFNINQTQSKGVATTYMVILIVSAVALFIDMIVINMVVLKNKHSILIPGIIYAVIVGVMFSMLTITVDWRLLGMSLGITVLAFFLMGLIAFLTKGSLSPLLIVIMGLGVGIGLLFLVNWIYTLVTGIVVSGLYIGLSIAVLALLMFITMYDMWRIKIIAESGAMSNNITLYSAFVIYTDFINVFLRILYFLIIIFGNKK